MHTPGTFQSRHIGPDERARDQMLREIGVASLDELIDQTIPPGIRLAAAIGIWMVLTILWTDRRSKDR